MLTPLGEPPATRPVGRASRVNGLLLSGRSLADWVDDYEADHCDWRNRWLHVFGIPLVASSLGLLLLTWPARWAWLPAGLMFGIGCVLQVLGHVLEGRRPSFARDPRFLPIGLYWWLRHLLPRAMALAPLRGDAPPAVAERVFRAQVDQLHRFAPASLGFSVVAASLVCWLLYPVTPPLTLFAWWAFAVVLNASRWLFTQQYWRAGDVAGQVELWARRHRAGVALNGTLWGICGTVMLPLDHPERYFALLVILGVIPGIAFSSQSAIRGVFMAFVWPFALPIGVRMLSLGGAENTVIGVSALVYAGVLWIVARRGEREAIALFSQRFENDDLMEVVQRAHRASEATAQELALEIEERRRAEAQLILARDEAESATRAKSRFLATMSHEIRTPMNGVLGMAEMLARTPLTATQTNYVDTIRGSGRTLLELINDILDFSKIEAGRVELEHIPFVPADIVQDVLEPMRPTADAKGIALRAQLASAATRRFSGDPTRLRQILTNLLGNAVKFTRSGYVELTVDVLPPRAGQAAEQLVFVVRDTGVGIDDAVRGRLFAPFSQGDSSTTREFGGTGLGLAITAQLVAMMDGRIDVESTLGEGSAFRVCVPLVRAADAPRSIAAVAAAAPVASAGNWRVLLVEDSAVNRLVAETMLRELGCAVDTANNGAEAVASCSTGRYDLVFMDCQMPVMDGFEATRRLRAAQGVAGGPPIVALTANAITGDRERCLAAGMNDYVVKPFTLEALGAAVHRWCRSESQS